MSKQIQDAYIVAATRTPVGKAPKGVFRNTRPDDMLAHVLKAVVAQAPPGGHGDGAVDAVQGDGVRRGQRLQRGDAGDDAHRHPHRPGGKPCRDPQAAVVERRVTPDEQRQPPAHADQRAGQSVGSTGYQVGLVEPLAEPRVPVVRQRHVGPDVGVRATDLILGVASDGHRLL